MMAARRRDALPAIKEFRGSEVSCQRTSGRVLLRRRRRRRRDWNLLPAGAAGLDVWVIPPRVVAIVPILRRCRSRRLLNGRRRVGVGWIIVRSIDRRRDYRGKPDEVETNEGAREEDLSIDE